MNRLTIFVAGMLIFLCSCSKETTTGRVPGDIAAGNFTPYRILKGQHYSEQSAYVLIEQEELRFQVRFDSTAIYNTKDPANQDDINKLYGFSDNDALHHQYSARIGWRWSDGALRLFAYVYNNTVVSYEELGVISIGADHTCSIKIIGDYYIFSVNGASKTMPRQSATINAQGYKLFPYFGGDETAPHDIGIWIKEK
jgi:hypothetical protein